MASLGVLLRSDQHRFHRLVQQVGARCRVQPQTCQAVGGKTFELFVVTVTHFVQEAFESLVNLSISGLRNRILHKRLCLIRFVKEGRGGVLRNAGPKGLSARDWAQEAVGFEGSEPAKAPLGG